MVLECARDAVLVVGMQPDGVREFLDLLATARNVVEGLCPRLTTLMSGTLQIVGPGSVSKDGPAVVALTVSATCGLWRSEVGAKVQVQVQAGAGGCRHRLQ